MNLNLSGKKALITGGAVGIGRAIALRLASEGADICLTSRNDTHLKNIAKELEPYRVTKALKKTDVSRPEELSALLASLEDDFGCLDIVVNNAGDTFNITDPYCSIDSWRTIFRLNVEVPIEINNFCIKHMQAVGYGRIVNVASGAGLENNGPVPYCASKAALVAYTRSMGRILATESPEVVMTAVCPGVVLSENGWWGGRYTADSEHARKYLDQRCALKRFGSPEEIAPLTVFLCSELASFCHGGIYLIDAGQARHFMPHSYL